MVDPDLQIREWGGGGGGDHPGPDIEGGASSQKHFSALRASFLKIRGGRGVAGPSPGSATATLSPGLCFWKTGGAIPRPASQGKNHGEEVGDDAGV